MKNLLTRRDTLGVLAAGVLGAAPRAAEAAAPFTIIVMDPLAAPLSCPCVKGYAQRDYEQLARALEPKLGRPVAVHFSESLALALDKKSGGKADLVIGKESVVREAAKARNLALAPVAALTDKQGKTTQTGLIVVASADPALTAGDLKGYRILFGPADCDEKHAAALELLKELGAAPADKPEIRAACSDGATDVLDLHKNGVKAATVISSYAQPLLEGCGTIKKGDLRVVGETRPVPFVVAFASEKLPEAERAQLRAALLAVGAVETLCVALETKLGFVAPESKKK